MSDWQSAEEPRKGLPAIPLYIWVLALVALSLAAVACGLWALYILRSQHPLPGPSPTPIIWTATPQPTPTSGPTPTETAIPTPTLSPDIAVGRYVRVNGTEGAGVSLRENPDVNSVRLGIGHEGEVFIVLDGPHQAGGYVWWLLRDPNDEARRGWAVGNYLQPVEHP